MPKSLFDKVPGLRPATLIKKRLWNRCFPVKFAIYLTTPFFYRTPSVVASVLKHDFFYITKPLREKYFTQNKYKRNLLEFKKFENLEI